MLKVNMIGLGYIGLPTAAVMADSGLSVTGTDTNENACQIINEGKIHIVEPGLDDIVARAVKNKKLVATTTPDPDATVYLIAVPTPFRESYAPDLTYIEQAARAVATVLSKGDLVILESTSPVGATERLADWLRTSRPDLEFPVFDKAGREQAIDVHIAYCPERVLPGQVIRELKENDRIIGGMTPACSVQATWFYKHFVQGTCCITNARTAEMAKLTENAFRDVNIAFANELDTICDELEINVWELIEMANRHPRVNILQPGCGVGGHCIAVDPWFIVERSPERARLIRTARETNDSKPEFVAKKLSAMLFEHLQRHPDTPISKVRVACYGLAFKPNIDDMRESPAVDTVKAICRSHKGLQIEIVEPHLDGDIPTTLAQENVTLSSLEQSMDADIKVVLVAHDCFKSDAALGQASDRLLNVAWRT